MKLHHPNPVLATPTGDWPATIITPRVLDALDTVDERGEVTGATMAMKRRLLRYGLAEPRGFGVYLTWPGWRVLANYSQQYPPDHKISYSHGREPVAGTEHTTWRGDVVQREYMAYAAFCICGWSYRTDREDTRRAAVRAHKHQHNT